MIYNNIVWYFKWILEWKLIKYPHKKKLSLIVIIVRNILKTITIIQIMQMNLKYFNKNWANNKKLLMQIIRNCWCNL